MIRRSPSQLSEFDGDSTNGRPKGETSSSNSRSSVISSSPSLLKPEDVNREVERLCRIFQSQSTGDLLTFTRDHSARDPLRLDAAISAFDYVDRNRGGKQTAAGQEQTVPTVASASSAPANSTQVNDRRQSGSERRELPPEQNWGLGGEAVAQPVPWPLSTADRDAAKTAIASVLSLLESKKALSGDIVRNQIISDLAGTDIGKELFDELRLDETATCETESLPTTSDDKLALAISSLVDKNQTIMVFQ
ncbi:hypothetical protein DFJ73DRAFT_816334 [Zopfochytrium polystomum]|nr:hypothetical protein DFJ73DRAFT_816334 [Zopfochytrium polystomum]